MERVFWVVPGLLAGRPGPNRAPWNLDALQNAGFKAILTLNDGEGLDPEAIASHGFDHRHVPMPPNDPAQPGDELVCRAALPSAYEWVDDHLQQRNPVLVHCSSGKDRTGLFMIYVHVRRRGLTFDEAFAAVREVQPRALTAGGWEELARRAISMLEARRES